MPESAPDTCRRALEKRERVETHLLKTPTHETPKKEKKRPVSENLVGFDHGVGASFDDNAVHGVVRHFVALEIALALVVHVDPLALYSEGVCV